MIRHRLLASVSHWALMFSEMEDVFRVRVKFTGGGAS